MDIKTQFNYEMAVFFNVVKKEAIIFNDVDTGDSFISYYPTFSNWNKLLLLLYKDELKFLFY